jgi:predicted  nucleic acid-binding Zn-ribbon protein
MIRSLITVPTLLLLTLLAACSGEPISREEQQSAAFADLRSAIMETVVDERRQRDVLTIVDALENDIDELRETLIRRRAELRAMNADYDATREDFMQFSREMEARIQSSRRQALDRRQALVTALTADEWESLGKAETRAMKAIARANQGI